MSKSACLLALLAGSVALACSASPVEPGDGELGRVSFSYHESCFAGCSLSEPVLASSTERIAMTGPGNDAGLSVRSSAPDIASFMLERVCGADHCDNFVGVVTGAPGDAKLELFDARGDLVDRVAVHVRAAELVRFERVAPAGVETNAVENLELPVGQSVELRARPFAAGHALLGEHGFVWHLDAPAVACFDYWSDATLDTAPDDARISAVKAVAPGETTLHVSAGGTEGTLAIAVE